MSENQTYGIRNLIIIIIKPILLTRFLVSVARYYKQFPARYSALQLLGCMGKVTKGVVDAIQYCMKDVPDVIKGALFAAKSLKHLHQSAFLPQLLRDLHHTSTLAAYSTAQLLTSLALHADSEDGGIIRQTILGAFAEASRDSRSRRYVCFDYIDAQIPHTPRLDQVYVLQIMKICNINVDQRRGTKS